MSQGNQCPLAAPAQVCFLGLFAAAKVCTQPQVRKRAARDASRERRDTRKVHRHGFLAQHPAANAGARLLRALPEARNGVFAGIAPNAVVQAAYLRPATHLTPATLLTLGNIPNAGGVRNAGNVPNARQRWLQGSVLVPALPAWAQECL
jgi:hypothetical protein